MFVVSWSPWLLRVSDFQVYRRVKIVNHGYCRTECKTRFEEIINVDKMKRRANKVFETLSRRCIDICYMHETKWKVSSTWVIEIGKDCLYLFFLDTTQRSPEFCRSFWINHWIKKVIPVDGTIRLQKQMKKLRNWEILLTRKFIMSPLELLRQS